MNLKFTVKLYVMAMKNDTKTEEELTCRFKTTQALEKLTRAHEKSKKLFSFNCLLMTKVYIV